MNERILVSTSERIVARLNMFTYSAIMKIVSVTYYPWVRDVMLMYQVVADNAIQVNYALVGGHSI